MLNKRIVGTVIIKNGLAVQSIGYNRYLPLGSPACIAENLDRWGADEILVLSIDRSTQDKGPDIEVIKSIAQSGLSTPLAYGGGISSEADASAVIKAGAERVCLDTLLHENPDEVENIALRLGAQAVIGAFPISNNSQSGNTCLEWFNHRNYKTKPLSESVKTLIIDGVISEALVIDHAHEGMPQSFDNDILHFFDPLDIPLIPFGGISTPEQLSALLDNPKIVAVGIGNFLSYREHAIQALKQQLSTSPIRAANYQQSVV